MPRTITPLGRCLLCAALLAAGTASHALTVRSEDRQKLPVARALRKPSAYDFGGAVAPANAQANRAAPDAAPAIASRAEFDALARAFDPGIPHVMFAIDRRAPAAPRLYFINTPRYTLHETFLRARGWLGSDRDALERNYSDPDRPFILGTLSWQPAIAGYAYEFWEGDALTPGLLHAAAQALESGFFAPVRFKANSSAQEAVAQAAGIQPVTLAALVGAQAYWPLNAARAAGRLRIVASASDAQALAPQDIAVLRETPLSLPPVAGVISERPSTALSHVNLLAHGWGIPNAYVQDAASQLARWDGQWVFLQVGPAGYTLRAASDAERQAAEQRLRQRQSAGGQPSVRAIAPDLRNSALAPLAALRRADRARCGAKAANLGEIQSAHIPDVLVPDGFCIPFAAYARFMQSNGLPERIARMRQQPSFATNPRARAQALAALRAEIEQWPLPQEARQWIARWRGQLRGQGVFVRSSSSAEDLPGFSGAGLYTTVPNVTTQPALEQAVREVWASVFNFEAWQAREAAGIDHERVAMAVLVQTAVNSSASGVMVTRDPLDAQNGKATYIAAKRGLGIRVVEGRRVAEQIIYTHRSKAVRVLTRSEDDAALQLSADGGVQQIPVEAGRAVLTDALVRRLARIGAAIERRFGNGTQDIEWAVQGDRIVILQARPFK